jgi:hypothetical protein
MITSVTVNDTTFSGIDVLDTIFVNVKCCDGEKQAVKMAHYVNLSATTIPEEDCGTIDCGASLTWSTGNGKGETSGPDDWDMYGEHDPQNQVPVVDDEELA